jgi:PAS domain S-box-containing protein
MPEKKRTRARSAKPGKKAPPGRLMSSLFERTVEDAPLGISVSRGEEILYVNRAWRRIMGVAPETPVVGLSHMIFVAPEDKKRVAHITKARRAGEQSPTSYDSLVARPDGARVLLHVSVTPVELEDGSAELVFLEDITEHQATEARAHWLSHIAEQVGEGVAVADLEGNLLFVNEAWSRMHGYRPEELVGKHLSISHSPEQLASEVLPFNDRVFANGRHTGEVGHIRKDGTPFPTEMTSTLLMDEGGQVVGIIGFAKEITERKRAEEARRLSEERFRRVFEDSPIGMAIAGPDCMLKQSNASFRQMLGYTEAELGALTFKEITHPEHLERDAESVRKVLSGELPVYRAEKRYIRKDGSTTWGLLTLSALRDGGGRFQSFLIMVEDITDRKRAEEALRASEEQFRTLAETAQVALMIYRGDKPLYVNSTWTALTGRSLEEARAGFVWDAIHPDDQALVRERARARQRGETVPPRYEFRIVDPQGEVRWLEVNTGLVQFAGETCGLATAVDITDRKSHEAALAESEERFRLMAETTSATMMMHRGGRVIYVNPAWERLRGYTAAEAVGRPVLDFVHPDSQAFVRQAAAARERGEPAPTRYELAVVTKSGEKCWSDVTSVLIRYHGEPAVMSTGFDVTERKRREAELAESEARFRTLAETTAAAIVIVDGLRMVYVNAGWSQISGFSAAEACSKEFVDFVHPDYREMTRAIGEALQRGDPIPPAVEFKVLTKRSGDRWVVVTTSPIHFSGRPCTLVTGVDVTERKLSEGALRESEERFRTLAETTAAAIMIYRGSRFLYVNPSWQRLTGYSQEDAFGREVWEFVAPEDSNTVRRLLQARQGGDTTPVRSELRIIAKDGRTIWGDFSAGLIQFEGKPAGLATAFDITDRKRAEEALAEREKLYRLILENVEEIVWSVDLGLDVVKSPMNFMSHQVKAITGYSPEEFQKDPSVWMDEIVHPEDQGRLTAQTRRCIQTGQPELREYRMRHRDTGEWHWVEDHVVPIPDESGRIVRIQGVARDVTVRKRAQADLERHNRELLAIMTSAQAMTGFTNLEEAAEAICKAAVEIFGVCMAWIGLVVPEGTELTVLASAGHDEGYTKKSRVRWDESKRARGPTGRAIKTRKTVVMHAGDSDFEPWRQDALKRGYVVTCAVPMIHEETVRGAINFYSGDPEAFDSETIGILEIFAREATMVVVNKALYREAESTIGELSSALEELQGSQKALKESEERYRGLVENAKGIVLLFTPDLKVTYWNEYAEEFFGFSKEEILGRSLIGTIVPKWESSGRDLEDLLARVAADPNAFASNINQNVTKDGRRVWVAWTNRPILDARGNVLVILSHGTDITRLKGTEMALRDSEERYRSLVDISPLAIVVADLQGHISMVNQRSLELVKARDASEVVGRHVEEFVPEQDRPRVAETIREVAERGVVRGLEYTLLREGGTPIVAEVNVSLIRDAGGQPQGLVGIFRDKTPEKSAAAVLEKSERLYRNLAESAHDFIFIVRRDGIVQYVNPYGATALGIPREGILGQRLEDLFPPATFAHMIESLRQVFETGEVVDRVNSSSFRGREMVLDTRLVPVLDADGSVKAAIGISRDVTGRDRSDTR